MYYQCRSYQIFKILNFWGQVKGKGEFHLWQQLEQSSQDGRKCVDGVLLGHVNALAQTSRLDISH
jgi:hypothetical protein